MIFNTDKFELLRYWPGKALPPPSQYCAPGDVPIVEKSSLRDLGVEISSNLSFSPHIDNVVTGATQLVGMILHTFKRRSRGRRITLWKTIVQPKIDYCSPLWSPADQNNIVKLESVMQSFAFRIYGCQTMDFWERLSHLKLYSQQKRRERYQMILVWKLSQGMINGYKIPFVESLRRGRLATYLINECSTVRNARESSLSVRGGQVI